MGNLERWIEELRTTELPQGHGQLLASGGYCCLGIGEKLRGRTDFEMGSACTPRQEFYDWLGIRPTTMDLDLDWPMELMPSGAGVGSGRGVTVTWLNDWAQCTFPQIADCVEYFGVKEAMAYA